MTVAPEPMLAGSEARAIGASKAAPECASSAVKRSPSMSMMSTLRGDGAEARVMPATNATTRHLRHSVLLSQAADLDGVRAGPP